jgi:hypothetical protein
MRCELVVAFDLTIISMDTRFCMQLESHYFIAFLPKSSTRRKSAFLFVIETARALTLVDETEELVPFHVSHEDLMYYNS